MKIGYVWTIVYACVLLTSALAPATEAPLKPPTWPQDFSVAPGERATFGIPNPGTGSIKVNVTWTGGLLTIAATGSDGKVVVPPADRSAPSHSFTIDTQTLGGPAKCPLVIVSLQLPKGAATNAKATGKFGVQSPPVDMARFQEQLKPLLAREPAKPTPPTAQQSALEAKAGQAAVDAKNKALATQRLNQAKTLMTQANTEIAARRNSLKSMANPANKIKTLRPPAFAGAAKAGALKAGTAKGTGSAGAAAKSPTPPVAPMLRGIAPQGGMTGEQVTLLGAGLTADGTEIHFTLAPNVVVQANILSFETEGDGTAKIKVQVPEKAGLVSPFAGQVVAKAVDRDPIVTTNALAFQFTPIVTPSIVYMDPVEVQPGELVQLQGNNFAQGDVIHFVIPGLGDYAAAQTVVRDTTLAGAPVPPYVAKDVVNGWIYIIRKVPAGWVSSQNAALIFNPSLPLIQSVPDSAEADSSILIRGVSFGGTPAGGTVAPASGSAGQTMGTAQSASGGGAGGGPSGSAVYLIDASGKEYALSVSSWTNTHIVARAPALAGFVNPLNCKIYVKTKAGKSDPKPITLKPSLTIALMLLNDIMMTSDYVFRNPDSNGGFALFPNVTTGMWLSGSHRPRWLGHRDDDEYFLKRKLRNGWVVDSIDFDGENTRLDGSRIGTDSPYLKIHWWSDGPWQTASYTVKVFVRGPVGTMY